MRRSKAPKRRWEERCAPGWDDAPPEEVRRKQDELLRRFITEQVYPHHPYYRRVFDAEKIDHASIRTVKDLELIPFTCKEDIVPSTEDPAKPREFVLAPGSGSGDGWLPGFPASASHSGRWASEQEFREEYQPVVTMFTTGRTAEPTPIFSTLYDLARMWEAGRRLGSVTSTMASEDFDLRGVTLNNFPGVSHLAYWVALTGAEGTATTVVSTGGGTTVGTERILNIMERVRPTMFLGLPGYTYDLLRRAAAEGRDLSCIEVVAMGGDRIGPAAPGKITALLEQMGAVDPVVTGAYGCTELKYAWGDCGAEDSTGYHTNPDMEIVEVVDPETGRVLGEGETGELVITNLDARGTVILRYRTGDLLVGGYTLERCPNCGRTMPRTSGEIKRVAAYEGLALSKVKGNLVDLNAFAAILNSNVDVLDWKVELRKRNDDPDDIDEVWIFVCPTSVGDRDRLPGRVVEDVRTALEFTPDTVRMVDYEELAGLLDGGGGGAELSRVSDTRPL